MLKKATSGQFLYFGMVSALSGNAVTGISGSISGRKASDGVSGMIVLSGNIIELGGGMFRANLFDFDCSGDYMGYTFTASGCVPANFTMVTQGGLSGSLFPASGVNVVVPIASISGAVTNSGLTVTVVKETISGVVANSGLFVTATASVASGSLYLASGSLFRETFASGVIGASGGFPTAWGNSGQGFSASGVNAVVPIASISGVNAVVPIAGISGVNAVVPSATLSGVVANSGLTVSVVVATISGNNSIVPPATLSGVVTNSGLTVTVIKETISGVVANSGLFVTATASVPSGTVYLASGSIFRETYASGVLGASGGHTLAWGDSGQAFSASGANVVVPIASVSGINAVVPVASISGVNAIVPKETLSGVVANSGLFVTATASVASGSLYLASGSIFRETYASGVLGASGGHTLAWGNSGQALGASGSNVVVPKETLSGVVANSGLFVTATASVPSGTVYLASGSIFRETYASGVLGASGGHTLAWGNSGQALAASGSHAVVPVASISGANAVVPISTVSGVNAVVPKETLSGVVANSGLFVSVPIATLSGVTPASGLWVASGSLSGQPITLLSGQSFVASGVNATVPKESLSGVVANSGLFVTATASVGSGTVFLASGHNLFWSGELYPQSGLTALVASGQLSGQRVDLLSGNQVQVWSGTQVNTFSGQQFPASGVVFGEVWDVAGAIESGVTPRQALRVVAAVDAGKTSGAGTGTFRIAGVGGAFTRVTATTDSSGNRTAVTVSGG
jgi:hypothetical protein